MSTPADGPSPAASSPAVSSPAQTHREIAGRFGELVRAAPAELWDAPAPVQGWTARDVVRHPLTWFPGFLLGGAGVELPGGPSVDDDPVAAWQAHADAVQGLLDDPATAERTLSNPYIGTLPLADAVDRFYTADLFQHTWDLARATGQEPELDERRCAELLEGMAQMEEVLRSSGQYGPRVEVPDDASIQDRLIGFLGRDPGWRQQLPPDV
ncbi:MAG: TIGR03086 family metal-binding protein [Nakamurella sp.]